MSEPERWTIGRLLQWTTDYLKKGRSASPRLDAEILLADARGCERIQLYTAFEEVPAETVLARFRGTVKRRAAGEPVAYLVGRREFYSLVFQVTPDVLIPRPETELVVLAVLDAVKSLGPLERKIEVADIGTGCGAIAISVAKHAPAVRVTASDISPEALAVAKSNAERHGVLDRIDFFVSDLLAEIPSDRRFDILASNPPYVAEPEMELLSRDVRDFEPRAALLGGKEGTEVIERLAWQAAEKVVPGGWLIVEIGPGIEEKVRRALASLPQWRGLTVTKDLAGLARVVKVSRTES